MLGAQSKYFANVLFMPIVLYLLFNLHSFLKHIDHTYVASIFEWYLFIRVVEFAYTLLKEIFLNEFCVEYVAYLRLSSEYEHYKINNVYMKIEAQWILEVKVCQD